MKVYKIDIGNGDTQSRDYRLTQSTFSTLTEARAALRAHNGGRLYGKFAPYDGVEGWNLSRKDGCESAVIFEIGADHEN